jgi:CRP-like cAMP-binding protein
MNVSERIADALVTMHDSYGTSGNGQTLNLSLSRQDLANLARTSKEQVSKTISEFKASGWVNARGRNLDILNIEMLRQTAQV